MQLKTTKRVFVYDQTYNKLEKNYQQPFQSKWRKAIKQYCVLIKQPKLYHCATNTSYHNQHTENSTTVVHICFENSQHHLHTLQAYIQ